MARLWSRDSTERTLYENVHKWPDIFIFRCARHGHGGYYERRHFHASRPLQDSVPASILSFPRKRESRIVKELLDSGSSLERDKKGIFQRFRFVSLPGARGLFYRRWQSSCLHRKKAKKNPGHLSAGSGVRLAKTMSKKLAIYTHLLFLCQIESDVNESYCRVRSKRRRTNYLLSASIIAGYGKNQMRRSNS